jgi:hypothetical protein
VDFTLHDLIAHFMIPEVPDVAAAEPAAYEAMLGRLSELEAALRRSFGPIEPQVYRFLSFRRATPGLGRLARPFHSLLSF